MSAREYGSEFEIAARREKFAEGVDGSRRVFLRSGRDAIGLSADLAGRGGALLPAYSCTSMSTPFVVRGYTCVFYPIKPDLSPNSDAVLLLARRTLPSVVLLCDYFSASVPKGLASRLKEEVGNITVVVDVTHTVLDLGRRYDLAVDFYVASLRKLIGIVNGGFLLSSRDLPYVPEYCPNGFTEDRRKAFDLKNEYFYTHDARAKAEYRRLFAKAEASLEGERCVVGADKASTEQIEGLDVSAIKRARRVNYEHLAARIADCTNCKPLLPEMPHTAPFSFPILAEDRDRTQEALASSGVYAPVLWPLDELARRECGVAAQLTQGMLSIPIDQRYGYADIEQIGCVIRKVCG